MLCFILASLIASLIDMGSPMMLNHRSMTANDCLIACDSNNTPGRQQIFQKISGANETGSIGNAEGSLLIFSNCNFSIVLLKILTVTVLKGNNPSIRQCSESYYRHLERRSLVGSAISTSARKDCD
jgi:hypothetical protein